MQKEIREDATAVESRNKPSRKERAQTIVEFALAFPVFLILILGIMEVGRAMAFSLAVNTAAREGARYGAAAGAGTGSNPRYQDCEGIHTAAIKIAGLVGIQDSNTTVRVRYDNPPSVAEFGSCTIGNTGPALPGTGNRIIVTVTAQFQPVIPLVNIPGFSVTSTSKRTIIKDIEIR